MRGRAAPEGYGSLPALTLRASADRLRLAREA
jgi:hypothetical protein